MITRLAMIAVGLGVLVGCQEYRVRNEGQEVADPPGDPGDELGRPPSNWQDCPNGLQGYYYNLTANHPYVTDGREGMPLEELFAEEDLAFDRYDPTLEFGGEWWPVDDGLAGDPEGFAVRWVGWIRGWNDSTLEMALGATTDAQVLIDDEVVAQVVDSELLDPAFYVHYLDGGVYPFEVRYAHRANASGMRFRLTGGDASICIPDYSEE